MGRPYSMDLRERAVRAVEVDGLSRHAAAARFGLGVSPVINWVRRRRAQHAEDVLRVVECDAVDETSQDLRVGSGFDECCIGIERAISRR